MLCLKYLEMQQELRSEIEPAPHRFCYVIFDPRIQEYTSGQNALHKRQPADPILESCGNEVLPAVYIAVPGEACP